jgi:4-alpha-glucanotransferase
MMFERHDHGAFRGLDFYLPDALVTFNTHDLATYAGWRTSFDLNLKRSIGMDPGESDDARRHALTMLGEVLRFHGIDREDFYAVVKFLAGTRSRLLALELEDLLQLVDQPNIPGTVNEHPNWRRRLPVPIDGILAAIDREALSDAIARRSH